MMRNIYLEGEMGEKFGTDFQFNAPTVQDALKYIDFSLLVKRDTNLPLKYIITKDEEGEDMLKLTNMIREVIKEQGVVNK